MVTSLLKARKRHDIDRVTSPGAGEAGFTMVEVIIAIVILAVGLLGMAGSTALVVRQVTMSELAVERSSALRSTIERLRSLPFDSVNTGSDSIGAFEVAWTVTKPSNQWAVVEIVTTGPGMVRLENGFPVPSNSVPDTFTHRILR